jgi:3D (Asp-Asp-Asp) domain-containing protein
MWGSAAIGSGGDGKRHSRAAPARRAAAVLLLAGAILHVACASRPPPEPPPAPPTSARELLVTAHAYTSRVEETDSQPTLAASGGRLRPGMRAIAVSPDLLAMGIEYGTRVELEGLGEWIVLDRMGDAHRRAVDLYMGEDRDAALAFGKRRVKLRW